MDLYRLSGEARDLLPLNLDQAFQDDISLIEWPQRLGERIPSRRLEIHLRIPNASTSTTRLQDHELEDPESQPRHVTLVPFGIAWEDRIKELQSSGFINDWIMEEEEDDNDHTVS